MQERRVKALTALEQDGEDSPGSHSADCYFQRNRGERKYPPPSQWLWDPDSGGASQVLSSLSDQATKLSTQEIHL